MHCLRRLVPPLLLIWYHFVGKGITLRVLCKACFFVTTLCGILALVVLWLVYPREVRLVLLLPLPAAHWVSAGE